MSILFSFFSTEIQNTHTIDTQGRSIQLDAFLIEWDTKSVKKINGNMAVFWDAINTPQGIAGYFRFPVIDNDSCQKTAIEIFPSLTAGKGSFSIRFDSIPSFKKYYAVVRADSQEGTSVISEWILPWDRIPADSMGKFEIGFFTQTMCEETLPSIILKGVKPDKLSTVHYTKQIVIQIAGIVVLLAVFIFLKKRIRFRQ